MRRSFSAILAALTLFLLLSLAACERQDDKTHDEILKEISEFNRANNEKRQDFLTSDVYDAAYTYLCDTLNELLPGSEYVISLEPGTLLGDELSGFADFADNSETRLRFFSDVRLYIKVNFWDYGQEAKDFAEKLMTYQISGELAADEFGEDVFEMDAISGKAIFSPMPGV